MGLHIHAVRQCRFLHPQPEQWSDEHDPHLYVFTYPAFRDRLDGLPEGCYETDDLGFGFGAGSYSGYGQWRAWLSQTQLGVPPEEVWTHYDEWRGKPFVELINFADNEGAIGPKTSAKLAEDFRSHPPVEDPRDLNGWYTLKYYEWIQAFERASDNGFVLFR